MEGTDGDGPGLSPQQKRRGGGDDVGGTRVVFSLNSRDQA